MGLTAFVGHVPWSTPIPSVPHAVRWCLEVFVLRAKTDVSKEALADELSTLWASSEADSWDATPCTDPEVQERDTPSKRILRGRKAGLAAGSVSDGVVCRVPQRVRPRMGKLDDVRRFLKLFDQIERIYHSAASDETKFDLIFGIGKEMHELHRIEYYDPDTTHAADVTAFVMAAQAVAEDLRLALGVDAADGDEDDADEDDE